MSKRAAFSEEFLPPWNFRKKIGALATISALVYIWYLSADVVVRFFWSLVERREAIAASLLPVDASLLGFSITSFSVLLSVRNEDRLKALHANYPRASRDLWTSLISASWATSIGALSAFLLVVLKSANLPDRAQSGLTIWLFLIEGYVALTFVGVVAVIHSLVIMLVPHHGSAGQQAAVDEPATSDDLFGRQPGDE